MTFITESIVQSVLCYARLFSHLFVVVFPVHGLVVIQDTSDTRLRDDCFSGIVSDCVQV